MSGTAPHESGRMLKQLVDSPDFRQAAQAIVKRFETSVPARMRRLPSRRYGQS